MTGKEMPASRRERTPVPGRRPAPPPPKATTSKRADVGGQWILAGLKAGLVGSVALAVLQLVNLVHIPLLLCLELPGYLLLLLITGALAGLWGGRYIETPLQAIRVGALGGFVTGVTGGVLGMLLASFGLTFRDLGYGVLAQFSPGQLEQFAASGISANVIQTAGSVLFALLIWGLGGTLFSMILSAVGGRIYYSMR